MHHVPPLTDRLLPKGLVPGRQRLLGGFVPVGRAPDRVGQYVQLAVVAPHLGLCFDMIAPPSVHCYDHYRFFAADGRRLPFFPAAVGALCVMFQKNAVLDAPTVALSLAK